jgi:hypothetical protein
MKIIPSFPPFAFPTSSRHRRHPCPTSRALGADVIDAHGAPLPRSGRTRKTERDARRIEARTSGGRLTRSTRVDGDVHARAQRGGAGGGHGKHPSFGARLRVEDASSGDSGVDDGAIAVSGPRAFAYPTTD